MSANTQYKDGVFRKLFSTAEELIDLYNALTGSTLPSDTAVEIATLENVLFNSFRDDIAFTIENRLIILIEHQSTINENMPLRFLLYLARIYEKLIDGSAFYNRRKINLHKPDFIVLYNGTDPFPEEMTLRLSDSFMDLPEAASLGGRLELEVRVLNINEGYNKDILERCRSLAGYSIFVAKINKYRNEGYNLIESITLASESCIRENILKEFLKLHASEVLNVMTMVYNQEDANRYAREEGIEIGVEKGKIDGILEAAKKMLNAGFDVKTVSKTLDIPESQLVS